jgi:hypothetical protein
MTGLIEIGLFALCAGLFAICVALAIRIVTWRRP